MRSSRRSERPRPIVAKVRQETLKVLAQPDMKAKFGQMGLDTVGNSPDELAGIIKSDITKWAKVIKEAGITATD